MLELRTRSRLGLGAGVVLALALLAPLLGPGYVLTRDMVFAPDLPLTGQLLGLDGVPRAVPSDLLVALASRILSAGWLQDVILFAVVAGGAWGAARLAPTTSRAGALTAATAYGWSAYLHERLLLGQWALLIGWAVLPWAVRAALDWREGQSGWRAIGCLAVAATGGASAGLLVGLTVLVCGKPLKAMAATAVFALPWAVPALLAPQGIPGGDPHGVAAFAADADTRLGVLGSLLTGGGIWAPAAVPAGRGVGVIAAVLVLLLAVAGLRRVPRRLVAAGAAGLVLAAAGRTPGLKELLEQAVEHVPAAGLLRDGQKWLAPFVLLTATGSAAGVDRLRPHAKGIAVLAVAAPLAALPGAAWGEGGRLSVSHYPSDWTTVTRQATGSPTLVLPWSLYRAFPWTDDRTVLDPALKLLPSRPVVDDDLVLTTGTVDGEDPLAAKVDAVAGSGEPLRDALQALHIGHVLVERTTRNAGTTKRQLEGLTLRVETDELALYDVPGGGREAERAPGWPVVLGDVVALLLGLLAAWAVVRERYWPAS